MRLFLVSIILKVLMSGLGMEDGLLMVVRCLGTVNKITFVRIQQGISTKMLVRRNVAKHTMIVIGVMVAMHRLGWASPSSYLEHVKCAISKLNFVSRVTLGTMIVNANDGLCSDVNEICMVGVVIDARTFQ